MAAGVATLRELHACDAPARMERLGILLRDGLHALSVRSGTPIRQTGPVQMPMVLFDDDADCRKGFAFCAAALRAGAYFHPRHNMFLSAAHTEEDIAIALAAAERGFAAVAAG
jgi:glutamate-1-semialdehyde 2,1-aminomutase